jgi:hypothetical protein
LAQGFAVASQLKRVLAQIAGDSRENTRSPRQLRKAVRLRRLRWFCLRRAGFAVARRPEGHDRVVARIRLDGDDLPLIVTAPDPVPDPPAPQS